MRNIFIACDTSDPEKVNKIIKNSQFKIKGYRVGYKFGLEFFIIIVVVAILILSDLLSSMLLYRFSGGLGGRDDMILQGKEIIFDHPFFGLGNLAMVEHKSIYRAVHNVPIALGTKFGVPAMLLGIGVILFNAYSFVYFLLACLREKKHEHKRVLVTVTIAALVITVRPNFSASVDSFYSLSEWVCFSLVIFGHNYAKNIKQQFRFRATD